VLKNKDNRDKRARVGRLTVFRSFKEEPVAESIGEFGEMTRPERQPPMRMFLLDRISSTTIHRLAILEPALAFAMIMTYIWKLHYSHRHLWLAILGLLVLSHRLRRERANMLGFQVCNLRECWRDLAPALVFLGLMLLACGSLLQTNKPVRFDDAFFAWAAYLPWGLLQQYVLNSYFLNRIEAVVSPRTALMVSAALFSGAHAPNWFLMGITYFAGYCSICIYRKYKNLYFLGMAHATVGVLILAVVPDSISHHFDVGPGWYRLSEPRSKSHVSHIGRDKRQFPSASSIKMTGVGQIIE
jgi:CAAX prenyl protease-like protein